MKRFGPAAALVVAALLPVACGANGNTDIASQTSSEQATALSTPTPANEDEPIMAAVDLGTFSPECAKVRCWLPTQFGPRLVERESVSLEERTADDPRGAQVGWPMDGGPNDTGRADGDKIEVVCTTKGGEYTNQTGQVINDWYRVVVPDDKVDPASKDRAERAPDDRGYLAYVAVSWLFVTPGREVPACEAA